MPEGGAKVLVTGASGSIAIYVVKVLVDHGYNVRGTVRSLKNETKVKPILDLGTTDNQIELVEADLCDEASWLPAVQGCEYVMHVASPLPPDVPETEDEVIQPAIKGTLSVLRACRDDGGVKRVVLTSSVAAVNRRLANQVKPYTEEDWPNVDDIQEPLIAYIKSKYLAEKAAWDFMKELPEDNRFELTVINPSFVIGPVLSSGYNASMQLIKVLLNKEMPAIANLGMSVVDIRDVAEAHVTAMMAEGAAGHRHILFTRSMWMKEMADILYDEFEPQGYNVPTRVAPDFMVRMFSWFFSRIRLLLPGLSKKVEYDNSRMRTVLKIPGRDTKATLLDAAYSMIEEGHVKKTDKYTGPNFSE